jgi:hypothetical protein
VGVSSRPRAEQHPGFWIVKVARAFPFFSAEFVVFYALAVEFNLALFTYHPQLKQFAFLVEPPKAGPAMYWYGWITTSALGALFISAFALMLIATTDGAHRAGFCVARSDRRNSFFLYLLQGYFLR